MGGGVSRVSYEQVINNERAEKACRIWELGGYKQFYRAIMSHKHLDMMDIFCKIPLDKRRHRLHKASRAIREWRNEVMLKRGFLVAFEGIDGAGKTTQAHLLYNYLTEYSLDAVLTKEPTDSIYGQKIKKLAQSGRESIQPHEEYNLFINDRKVHVKNLLEPSLSQKKIVILDRYYFSTIAYQGAIGLDPVQIKMDNEQFSPIPEIVFLLEVPPRVGIRRIQNSRNETPNLFEQEEYLTAVAKVFNSLSTITILLGSMALMSQRLFTGKYGM